MFKFTIRELLLFTVVMGLAVAWWVEHRRATVSDRRLFLLIGVLRTELEWKVTFDDGDTTPIIKTPVDRSHSIPW